jgi:single-strand DNA-binding protein
MYQNLTLIGNLGTDPTMRYTPSGVAVADFTLAVNRSWTGQDGQQQNKTTWFKVSCWNKLAETVTQYLTKGRLVLVVGEIEEARAYSDKDGNLRASLEVKAMSVKFLGKPEGSTQSTSNTNTSVNTMIPSNDEDIPF